MKLKTILIIDDNEDDYFVIKRYVKKVYNTIYDNGIINIIELIKKNNPDCILIDYHLGTRKGLELLKEIKLNEDNKIKNKPVIILTGETNPEIIVECMKNDATDYIIKGEYSANTIIKTITQAIEKNYLKQKIQEQKEEKKKLEELLNHNRRINSIGQLAGGIAHDFNNIIAGIIGATELLNLPERKLDETSKEYTKIIMKASNRASSLVSKLLAYGRKGKITSNVLDIKEILKDSLSILNTTITDKRINISFKNNAENNKIIGDNAQLQNALMNLVINASQAMPNGGEIKIITTNISLNDHYCKNSSFDIKPGQYVQIEVKDNGTGISSENINKIFEPFYTTKKINEGTGLGLSAVYGIIQDHYGEIKVTSKVNLGTSFKLIIPNIKNIKMTSVIENTKIDTTNNIITTGKILLVDDEEIIRIIGKKILTHMGYNVIIAKNGKEAVDIYKKQYSEIDVVIMDMLMPKLNGKEAFAEMKIINKNCKIVISSGFLKDHDIEELKTMGLAGFIHKPYKSEELNKLLKKILKTN